MVRTSSTYDWAGHTRAASVVLLIAGTACGRSGAPVTRSEPTTLRIGFGLTAGTSPEIGIQQTARNIALEGLVRVGRNGRAIPVLAERWTVSEDGLSWRFFLRSASFHDGKPVKADAVRTTLLKGLPQTMGPAFEDIREIRVIDDATIEIALKRPSAFLLEGLDVHIEEPRSTLLAAEVNAPVVGTGPFMVTGEGDQAEMRANDHYYGGRPAIDRIDIMPYTSVRAAWADMLRGQVDALYEVGADALDSLGSSSEVNVFTFQRAYAHLVLLNVRRPYLGDPQFRRDLNAAIDREALVRDVLKGHGTPAQGASWPGHWAHSTDVPRLQYKPRRLASPQRGLTLLFVDPSHERLALSIQKQLQAIGVNLKLDTVPGDQVLARLQAGDFDLFLADYVQGPNLVRPYLFWHSDGPFNWGHYHNKQVDAALDTIRHARNDQEYQAGVGAFEGAIVDDPPAIFLAWRERARAVSTRFVVPSDPGSDVLTTIHLWRPAAADTTRGRN